MNTDKKETASQQPEEELEKEEIKQEPAAKEKESKKKAKKEPEKKQEPKENEAEIKAAAELAALNDKYLRICAEYDNFRRRSQKEKEGLYGDVKAEAVKAFLPVYDNLDRALKQSTEDEAYRKGVEMIMTQFVSTLTKLGVSRVESLGEKFDPELHNAVMHVEDEEKGENEIVEVFQEGFRLGEKVIRFAMVKVAN